MLSIGWVEMLVVASFALIVVGPRDLPAMLRQIGKMAGTARRMSNEFRSELNKVTAIDEVRDIQKSIKEPFKDIKSGLESEFNKMGKSGSVEPTGALKTDDSATESVVDDIRAKAGLAREGMNKAAVAKRDADAAAADAAKLSTKTAVADVPATTTQKPKTSAKTATRAKPKVAAKPRASAKPKVESKSKTAAAKTPRKPRAKATTAAAKTPKKPITKKTPAQTSVGEA